MQRRAYIERSRLGTARRHRATKLNFGKYRLYGMKSSAQQLTNIEDIDPEHVQLLNEIAEKCSELLDIWPTKIK